jgi:hypothetical protein
MAAGVEIHRLAWACWVAAALRYLTLKIINIRRAAVKTNITALLLLRLCLLLL